MPISVLPEDTIRTIGSTQVLTDSASLVKELIDNAIDSRASAIFIEISANALDVIQVKDNGYGVAPVDRALVCKRYCTSKISSFDDVATIGGMSLGFRGEALASAAEMSGALILTTRVEGEATATSLKIDRQGEISSEERASHPVGTTIRVIDYLKNLPVRYQNALKSTTKALSTITRTLQAYALARPATRFSLRVLKAKNEKANWTYAPKPGASVQDAATKVVGKRVVEQCHWQIWSSWGRDAEGQAPEPGTDLEDKFTIEALLAKPGCDVSSITRAGQYLSIDSRPMSSARGTLKLILALYKSYLRSSCGMEGGDKIADPFICMNIICPTGSYDANIEPAKDDVLFTDASLVLATLEAFFKSVYGEIQSTSKVLPASKASNPRLQGFDALLARKPQPPAISSPRLPTPSRSEEDRGLEGDLSVFELSPIAGTVTSRINESVLGTENTSASIEDGPAAGMPERTSTSCSTNPSPKKAWKPNMYVADDDEAMDLFFAQDHHGSQPQTPDPDEEAGLRDVRVSNPWVIAKVNASIRPYQNQRHNNGQLLTPIQPNTDPEGGSSASPATVTSDANPSPRILLTPQQSHRESSDPGTASSSPERFPYPLTARNSRSGEHALKVQRAANRERYGGALDTCVRKSINGHSDDPSSTPDLDEGLSIDSVTGNTRHHDFVSARTLPTGTPLSEIPTAPTRVRRQSPQKQTGSGINKPFTSPLTNDRVWFDLGQKRKGKPSQSDRSQSTLIPQARLQPSSSNTTSSSPEQHSHPSLQTSSPNTTSSSPERPIHPDLASSLDYEHRKTLATQQHRATLLRQQQQPLEHPINHTSTSPSPHQNRYNKAIAALHHQPGDASPKDLPSPPQPSISGLNPSDPRHYLLRVLERERAPTAHNSNPSPSHLPSPAKRRKTSKLPLESVPSHQSVRDLVLPLSLDLKLLAVEVKAMGAYDGYIASGTRGGGRLGAAMGMEMARKWEGEIGGLVGRGVGGGEGEGAAGLRLEIWPLLQEHARRYCLRGEVEGGVESV